MPIEPSEISIPKPLEQQAEPAWTRPWNPPFCGDSRMVILRDGTWLHDGRPIRRAGMVRLFASVLRREGAGYMLVTPVEKMSIRVEDVPFVAVDVEVTKNAAGPVLTFVTNLGEHITAGPMHPIQMRAMTHVTDGNGDMAPYVQMRPGIEARIDRKTFYRLAELADVVSHDGEDWLGLRSDRAVFPLVPMRELDAFGQTD